LYVRFSTETIEVVTFEAAAQFRDAIIGTFREIGYSLGRG